MITSWRLIRAVRANSAWGRPISRRDFFDGVAMAAGAAALSGLAGCGLGANLGRIGTDDLEVPYAVRFLPR
ncbi:hypothetical protein [Nonomuraea dietziae]|uniref:hypothetical protein n=1 Tax=Nonomuraea dietziae TaxID=65515 RepID=UPI0031D2F81B